MVSMPRSLPTRADRHGSRSVVKDRGNSKGRKGAEEELSWVATAAGERVVMFKT